MSPRKAETAARRCPVCRRPTEEKFRPFCSKRCADFDLARWIDGSYAIPAEEQDQPDGGAGGDGEVNEKE
jgi:hypothetical protein